MWPTQGKKRLEWATLGLVAGLDEFFPQPVEAAFMSDAAMFETQCVCRHFCHRDHFLVS